jgi:hypothetical protein
MRTIKLLCLGAAAFTLTGHLVLAGSSGTAFTYQGRLFIGDVPANGLYDLQFTNYDAAAGGNALAAIQGLNQKLEETRADNAALRADNADLRERLEKLERLLQPSN